jgi:N-acetylneuraminate synthase
MPEIAIAGRTIGAEHPPYVVAELSANHVGDLAKALAIIEAAHAAGADAVKLQTYRPEDMTLPLDAPGYRVEGGTLWDGRLLYDLYGEAQTPWAWHEALFRRGAELGITIFSSPFSEEAVDLLEKLGAPAYKIASFEIVHLPLIRHAARTGKPLVMSTGLATLDEVREAVDAARSAGATQIVLLKCTSAYPAPPEEMNLRAIPFLAETFGLPIGLSDHTLGTAVALGGVALGACLIEKHVILRRSDGGPDAAFSLEPSELAELCTGVRTVHRALGRASFELGPEQARALHFRRSLILARDIARGEVFTDAHLAVLRPAIGIAPKYREQFLGRRAARDLHRGDPLDWSCLAQP